MSVYDDGDPHFCFQQRHREEAQNIRRALEDAFAFLIMESSEREFSRLFDALADLKRRDVRLYQSLRGHTLVRSVMDMVDAEDKFRCERPLDQRKGDGHGA